MSIRSLAIAPPIVAMPTRDEVGRFLTVGGIGYVVDVLAFNLLLSIEPFATAHPAYARTLAVVVAMLVTYVGNRTFTWRDVAGPFRRHEVLLFVLFNVIGYGFSLAALVVSHDVLGLTGRLADNISANVVGLALGTAFRFFTYRRFVFRVRVSPTGTSCPRVPPQAPAGYPAGVPAGSGRPSPRRAPRAP